jgi:hypothetical protein
MKTSSHNTKALAALLPWLCALAGCFCQAYPLPDETHCPTDARRLYCGCGEEAVRRCPCGPDRQFYGLKPTDWRPWPAGWRCEERHWNEEIIEGPQFVPADADPSLLEQASASGLSTPAESTTNPFAARPATASLDVTPQQPEKTLAIAPPEMTPPENSDSSVSAPASVPAATAPEFQATGEPERIATKPPAKPLRAKNPNVSDRVGEHLMNNLSL